MAEQIKDVNAKVDELEAAAKDAAELIGLPLEIIQVGDKHLEEQLLKLIGVPSE